MPATLSIKRETGRSKSWRRSARRQRSGGVELVEFSFTFLPYLAIVTTLVCISWGVFAKSALQYAVKVAVRDGITYTKETVTAADLTTAVKNLVQQNSFGLLKDTSLVHVHYYQPPLPSSTGGVIDVSSCTAGSSTSPCTPSLPGNSPGNVMVVSVDGFSLSPLIARIFAWNKMDKSSTTLNVSSADLIEQLDPNDLPPLGVAP